MSKAYLITINKEVAQQCINWAPEKPEFISKHEAKGQLNKKSYSSVIYDLILEKFGAKMRVNDGKSVGSRWVSVYMQCKHSVKFTAQIPRSKFAANKNLEFVLSRSRKDLKSCSCGKKNNFTIKFISNKLFNYFSN